LAVTSRFLIDLRVAPRTLEVACQLVASVALCCTSQPIPLLLIDNHLPYPKAILQVFGILQHRRRQGKRGRKRKPTLKAPPELLVGVVKKVRDATGNLLDVNTHALFGTKKVIETRIQALGIGEKINTSHIERLNGTLRGQQARLVRRTQAGTRLIRMLCYSLALWRDLYNWISIHSTLGCTPAMALGLAKKAWTVLEYVRYPVHLSDLQRELWEEQRNNVLKSPLDDFERSKALPTS
jgi:hypothetical protein